MSGMDEAFLPLAQIIERMMAFRGEVVDDAAGVRSRITGIEIDSPVELDVTRDSAGRLIIGTTPPLYPLQTTVAPSFHRVRFTARLNGERDG